MPKKKGKKDYGKAAFASVKKEMAKPRMARSARIAELKLDTERIVEQPSTTMPGKVDKIIPSPRPSHRLVSTGRTTGIEISALKIH